MPFEIIARTGTRPRRVFGQGGFALAACLMLALPATAQQMPKPGPGAGYTGSYAMEGRNPDGSAYAGTVDIVQSGTLAILTWRIGENVYVGTGVASSRSIAAAYGPIIVLFEKSDDGALTGVWTAQGHNKLGYEILRRRER
jgi:hypothetical protein